MGNNGSGCGIVSPTLILRAREDREPERQCPAPRIGKG